MLEYLHILCFSCMSSVYIFIAVSSCFCELGVAFPYLSSILELWYCHIRQDTSLDPGFKVRGGACTYVMHGRSRTSMANPRIHNNTGAAARRVFTDRADSRKKRAGRGDVGLWVGFWSMRNAAALTKVGVHIFWLGFGANLEI